MTYPKLVPGQETFSTFQVSGILGINRERLREWMKFGFIPSGTRVAWKASYKTVWSKESLYHILFFKRLVDAGMRRKKAAEIADEVDWHDFTLRKKVFLVVAHDSRTAERTYALVTKAEALAKLKDWDVGVVINVQNVIQDVDSRI